MKQNSIILLLILLSTTVLNAQNLSGSLSAKLLKGYPKEIKRGIEIYGFEDVKFTSLETGVETIQVYFGSMKKNTQGENWFAMKYKDKTMSFMPVQLSFDNNSHMGSKRIDYDFDGLTKRISFQIEYNSLSNEIVYTWLKADKASEILCVDDIGMPIQLNKKMPDVTFEFLDGKLVPIKSYSGKIVVINLWSTTCGPCIKEMPLLNKLVKKYKSHKNIEFISYAFEKSGDLKGKVKKFLKKRKFIYNHTIGNKESARIFGMPYPKNIIVNQEGIVSYYEEGGLKDTSEMEEELEKLLTK